MMKLTANNKTLDLSTPQIMGILNTTPDSFSDGGQYATLESGLNQAKKMIEQGATIIDIGGESTRPGAMAVSLEVELSRTIPLIKAIRAISDIWISIDTSKAEVMRQAVEAGADIINDVKALTAPNALATAASLNVPICLMHMQGEPTTMQHKPNYQNVVQEVGAFLEERIRCCNEAGISTEQLILDPGFGFGKTLEHNYILLNELDKLHQYGLPLLVGLSRKSMIFKLLNKSPQQCVAGSLACATIAAQKGAQIIRVHDVEQTVDAVKIVNQLNFR